MAVSKYHAYVFWDQQNTIWSIVDAGSVHGTFIQRDGSIPPLLGSINEPENKVRLSAQRTASQPLGLQHLDYVDIGSTTFVAHIHSTEPICEQCIGTQVILLSEATLNPASSSRKPVENQIRFETLQDPKKALKDLKSVLLNPTRHSPLPSQQTTTATATYVDRSARRREITGSYGSGSSEQSNKDVIVKPRSSNRSYVDPRLKDIFPTSHNESPPAITAPVSNPSPAPPIPSSNIGHRLLVKSGWSPGQALGPDKSSGLVQPLNLKRFEHRAGIGSDNSRREDG
ncbi:hypothetical protein FRC03_002030 [Tulasnella sp. 419]|nr:hypothetical protein FRC03_002030 [Tulasnella sp. 419]